MPYSDQYFSYMSSCCGDASIVSYDDDCGIYCVALDQTISDLIECLMEEGAEKKPQDVFCSGNTTESKTEDGNVPATAGVSVVATGGNGGESNHDEDERGSESATSTSSSDESSETGSGAAGGGGMSSISLTAVVGGSMMLLCFVIGAL